MKRTLLSLIIFLLPAAATGQTGYSLYAVKSDSGIVRGRAAADTNAVFVIYKTLRVKMIKGVNDTTLVFPGDVTFQGLVSGISGVTPTSYLDEDILIGQKVLINFMGDGVAVTANGDTLDVAIQTGVVDSITIVNLGFVAGAHTIDTDTKLDSLGIVAFGFVAGAHTDSTAVAGFGFVVGAHTIDTDTFVTNKDTHDHLGGDGAQILHSSLGSVGANDHHTPTVDTDTQLSDAQVETAYNNQVAVVLQAEAEAGTATTRRGWTAQRVSQAIAALETSHSTLLPRLTFADSLRNAFRNGPQSAAPVAGDSLIAMIAGVITRIDVGNLPTGGGGEANTISSQGGRLALTAATPKSGVDLRVISAATLDFNVVADSLMIDDAKWGTDAELATHAALPNVHHTPTVDTDTFVTNKDTHDHLGGDGAQILHSSIGSVGTADHHTRFAQTEINGLKSNQVDSIGVDGLTTRVQFERDIIYAAIDTANALTADTTWFWQNFKLDGALAGVSVTVDSIHVNADTDNFVMTFLERNYAGGNVQTVDVVTAITNGVNTFYITETVISGATIEVGHWLGFLRPAITANASAFRIHISW